MSGSCKWSWVAQAFIFLALAACGLGEDAAIPAGLYGTWETGDPRYAGCSLEISESLLVFHGKDGGLDINHITAIKKQKGSPPQLAIHYKNKEGRTFTLKVDFEDAAGQPSLRLHTPKTLNWTRRSPHGN